MTSMCRSCGSSDLRQVIDLGAMPIAHRLLDDRHDDSPTFPFSVHVCLGCGLTQIVNPIDPLVLYGNYNYCFSTWKEQPHISKELGIIFDDKVNLSSLIEVGSNDGLFLLAASKYLDLCIGIEANPVACERARRLGVQTYNGFLNERLARAIVEENGRFDVLVARQVLEHLPDLGHFFACVKLLLKDDGLLFLDVPDAEQRLAVGEISVLWEEHVSYFTEATLRNLLAHYRYSVESVYRFNFSGGTIAMTARGRATFDTTPPEDITAQVEVALGFPDKVRAYTQRLRSTIRAARERGRTVVIYGAGCRACTLINGAGLAPIVDYIVDDQMERQNKYIPGAGLHIRASRDLANEDKPVLVFLAVNEENDRTVSDYLKEIVEQPLMLASLHWPADIEAELDRTVAGI